MGGICSCCDQSNNKSEDTRSEAPQLLQYARDPGLPEAARGKRAIQVEQENIKHDLTEVRGTDDEYKS